MTDLATLETTVGTLVTTVGTLHTQTTTLFGTITTLRNDVATEISEAVETSENAALEPMMSMAASFAALANIVIVSITPET